MTAYSVVIATYERPQELRTTLQSMTGQSHMPVEVIIVDSSKNEETETVAKSFIGQLPLRYERAEAASAAKQRNQGARNISTPLVVFVDDDVRLPADVFQLLTAVFDPDEKKEIGGVAARIANMQHAVPKGLLRAYFRMQAGYDHPTYGGKLFGPAINCLPSYTEAEGDLIPADWLNSTCVCYRTELFQREKFPAFDGYSFMEDVHVSARIGKTHKLFFHKTAVFEHLDATSSFKRNRRQLARMRVHHQRRVARDVMGMGGFTLWRKMLLHRIFATVSLLRWRGPGWKEEVLGTWM